MSVMAADTPQHARRSSGKSRADVWFVLILTGAASATLQMWHATHAGGAVWLIAGIVGIVPPLAAIGLSHVVASHKGTWWLRAVTILVMLAVMAASASSIAAVVGRIEVPGFNWVFAFALDAAALASVWVLLGDTERKAAESSALQAAERAAREAGESARRAESERDEVTAKAVALEAELTAARGALDALRSDRNSRRGSGRHRTGTGTRKRQPAPARSSAPEPGVEDAPDLDTEARILALIAEGHSASAAGVMAGKSDSYGRQVARLAKAAKREPAGDVRSDGDMDTGEQPRVQ